MNKVAPFAGAKTMLSIYRTILNSSIAYFD